MPGRRVGEGSEAAGPRAQRRVGATSGHDAEAGGLDGVWLGEIHFNGGRSIQSAPLALASFIAARTRRLRVGIARAIRPDGRGARDEDPIPDAQLNWPANARE